MKNENEEESRKLTPLFSLSLSLSLISYSLIYLPFYYLRVKFNRYMILRIGRAKTYCPFLFSCLPFFFRSLNVFSLLSPFKYPHAQMPKCPNAQIFVSLNSTMSWYFLFL